jgi:ComF family protein
VIDLLFPPRCVVCDRAGEALCDHCIATLQVAAPFDPPDGLRSCRALLDYAGSTRALVAALKYRNHRAVVARLGRALAALAAPIPAVDVVTWPPTSRSRRRDRGFDQAELLARSTARVLGRPVRRLLARIDGPAQTDSTLAGRRVGPGFDVVESPPRRVLLVDDVVTTGATLANAARALYQAGAADVHGVAVARTRPPSSGVVTHSDEISSLKVTEPPADHLGGLVA